MVDGRTINVITKSGVTYRELFNDFYDMNDRLRYINAQSYAFADISMKSLTCCTIIQQEATYIMKGNSHVEESLTESKNPFKEMLDLQVKGLRKLLNDRIE
jgi:hypothetical protein